MNFVIFGLSVSSSWGNGHAALWRGLINGLLAEGHRVTFFERDVPYYADHRDLHELPRGGDLVLYSNWNEILPQARSALKNADIGMVTSYCPDALAATALLRDSNVPVRCFYDLDTPVTLARLDAGEAVGYVGPDGFVGFDLVMSYTGGAALQALRDRLGAKNAVPIYGSADPAVHFPVSGDRAYALSYLGTYAADRQAMLESLLIAPAHARLDKKFVIGGAQYPQDFPWKFNIDFVHHLPPSSHRNFYARSRLTLNVTRGAMAAMGWCPSGRLFEAAACGVPILSDSWDGLTDFFTPGETILVARNTEEALAALDLSDAALHRIAIQAREHVLANHSAKRRAQDMVNAVETVMETV